MLSFHKALPTGCTDEYVAIKFIKRGQNINKYVGREIVNHSNLLHPHIVQFKQVFLTEEYLAIVMEYVQACCPVLLYDRDWL